ncbi:MULTISPECIES: 30S ribosome-binding factor RbfA [Petrimonas]|jgi:ribosome-binding factor A|uniref:Ribosome-binding factor A n=1 Tax=Petrimonas mucosa TaxID=1642646 RepID=A0A1G4GA79_9BACT|nr:MULTISPECIES: 30S ribosome-binding factor RbfA [Petrimonas]MDD3560340.1 30S ribosome-binding factor RbfA [Petrimonas mucosa]SCM59459.1 Ribosome-binding factor A {ECO:0000255/HAMAP-Rule:MF_00003} [Petrimonas mucosa]SFU34597.1 ribosome-binding factor A [Porphyromonadaceae bacterium KHP3R9]HHT30588.1 30S ribosome-binding factor RbfA [Petrimonas mucosa]
MESNRLQKVNRLIQKELGEIFLMETKKMPGVLVSVTHVRVTPDLGMAHTYLSIFPSERGNEIVQNVNDNVKSVRFALGKRIGKQLRIVPELVFHLDDSLDYIDNIDKLLK